MDGPVVEELDLGQVRKLIQELLEMRLHSTLPQEKRMLWDRLVRREVALLADGGSAPTGNRRAQAG